MLVEIVIGITGDLILTGGTEAVKKLFAETPARLAIASTNKQFPGLSVDHALNKWIRCDDFATLLEQVIIGKRERSVNALVRSFIEVGEFYNEDVTEPSALEVLEAFFAFLQDEIYKSKSGLSTHARRVQTLFDETRAEVSESFRQQTDEISAHMSSQFSEIKEWIQGQKLLAADNSSSSDIKEAAYNAQIDTARDLIPEGKPETARKILTALREKLSSQEISDQIRFRLAASIGVSSLHLNDLEVARAELENALSIKPDHQPTLSTAAVAAMADEDHKQALALTRRARPSGEKDSVITANHIRVLYFAGEGQEIDLLLREEPWIAEDSECSFVLGLINLDKGEYATAETYLRTSLKEKEENPHIHHMLAQSVMLPIDRGFKDVPPLPWRLPPDVRERIEEAEHEFSRAIELFEHFENRNSLEAALLHRAYVRGVLGRTDEAIHDCDRVLSRDQNDSAALRQKGNLLLLDDKIAEATKCFAKVEDPDEQKSIATAVALAHLRNDDPGKVMEVLLPHWSPEERTHRQLTIADLLLWAYHQIGNTSAVNSLIQALEKTWGNEPASMIAIARQRQREGNAAAGITLLREAMSRSQEEQQRDHIALTLGNLYYDESDWAGAAESYEKIVDKSNINPLSVKYLLCLFNSGAYREALTLATALRNGGPAIPIVSEVEAQVFVYAKDFERSLDLFIQLRALEPRKVTHRLWIIDLQRRKGNRDAALEAIESIRFEEIKDTPELLMRVAVARLHFGMSDFLSFAYRARRLAFDDPNIHIAYLSIFLNREARDEDGLHPTSVGADCAVHLENKFGKRVFLIVDQEPLDLYRGEIAPSDPLALKMLGHEVGDEVVLKDNHLEEVSYRITKIQSKYVYAFQETGSQFTTLFPDNPAFSSIDTSGGDYSKIFTMLDRRAEQGMQAMSLYRENRFPLTAIARMLNHTLIEMWAGLISSEDTFIYASSGLENDADQESKLIARVDTIVLDLSALLTMWHLDLLECLRKTFKRILIAQAVLDEVNEQLSKERLSGKESSTIWKEGDHYAYQEISEAARARRQSFLEALRSFIETYTEVVPAMSTLDIPKKEYKDVESLLGEGAIASILVAKEREALLYADDFGLRQMANQDWQVCGVWTQTVLESIRNRGLISLAEYYNALRKLILASYNFVRVDVRGLLWILRHNEMKASVEMRRILAILSGPHCDEMSAVVVGAEFTFLMWLQVPIYEEKIKLLDYILDSVLTGRIGAQVVPMFKAALRAQFAIYPKPLPTIFGRIEMREE